MENRELFKYHFENGNTSHDLNKWLEWVSDYVKELVNFNILELYFYNSSLKQLQPAYFEGDQEYFNEEGSTHSLALHVYNSGAPYIFPHSAMHTDPLAQTKLLSNLPRWKFVLPIKYDDETIGVIAICSASPVVAADYILKKLADVNGQTGIAYKNSVTKRNGGSHQPAAVSFFENIPQGYYVIDRTYHLLQFNPAFEQFIVLQHPPMEVRQGSLLTQVLGNEFVDFKPYFDKAFKGEKQSFTKTYLIAGEDRRLRYTISPVGESGAVTGAIVMMDDVSGEGAEPKTVKPSVYNSLVQHIPDVVWIIDDRGNIKFVNTAFERTTGYTAEEVVGRSSFEFFSKEELPNHLQQMLLYLSGANREQHQFFQFKFLSKRGEVIILESTSINLLNEKDVRGIVVSARNITRQATDKQQLEDKEELYRSLFESLSEAILITDNQHNLIYCNSVLTKMTGYTLDELGTMPLYQLIVAEEYWGVTRDKLSNRASGIAEQYEIEIIRKDGSRFWASIVGAPYRNKNREIVGSVSALTDITQRRKTEEEMRWLAKFPEENPSPILRISKEGKIIYHNSASKVIIRQIGNPDTLTLNEEWSNIISKHTYSNNVGKIDLDIEGKYFSLTLTPLISNTYINIYATDISDRIAFQKQLLESEQRLQFLMNSTTEGIMVHENGIILDLNLALARMFGYSYEEMMGKSILNFSNEKNRELIAEKMREDITLPYETLMYKKEGTAFHVEIQGRAHFYKGRKVKVVAIRDITSRKKAEQLSRENEERLRYFLSITSEGILLLDDGKIIDTNSAFTKMVDMKPEEIIGQPVENIYDHTLRDKLLSLSSLSDSTGTEFKFKRKDGTTLHVELLSQLQEYRGRMIRVALIKDITRLKKDEEELVTAKRIAEEAQKAEEQFLAKMSHEIRTPMNGIIGLTDILLKSNSDAEQSEYLNLIKESADNLLVIINDILDLSKIRAGKIQFESIDINLRELFKGVYSNTLPKAAEKNIAYNYTVDSRVPDYVKGDQVRLNQIMLNLISNSLKFTEGGKIHFNAELISQEDDKLLIQFKVEDSGIGIHEKDQDRIFEPYGQAGADTTRKFGGTGLGLPIVKQLVEMQGGTIWLQSKPGSGSTFFFTLPFEVSEKAKKPAPDKAKPAAATALKEEPTISNGISVLLVDDNFINRLLVNHLLEQKGYNIIEAENGYQAIEKLKEEDIDLVLMDISMPDLDGLEATKIIRKMEPAYIRQIPIIAMTAHAFQDQIQGALDAGMNDYISKPFKPEELYNKIENQLNPPIPVTVHVPTANPVKPMEEKQYDLTFLNQYYDNEEEFITSILALYAKETPNNVTKIEESVNRKDWPGIKALCHKIKTNILMMGIKKAEDFLQQVASQTAFPADEAAFFQSFSDFKQTVLTAVKQIEKDKL